MSTRISKKKQRMFEGLFARGIRVVRVGHIEMPCVIRLTNGQSKHFEEIGDQINAWLTKREEHIEYCSQMGENIPDEVLFATEEVRLEALKVTKEFSNGEISHADANRKIDLITAQAISTVVLGFQSETAAFEFKMRWL